MRLFRPLSSSSHPFRLLLPLLCVLFLLSPAATARGADPYLDELLSKAKELRLHEERGWKSLLHYARSYRGVERSRIGDERFFLSPAGKTDSAAELEATLGSFFLPSAGDGEHPTCRFPARLEWLTRKLEIDPTRLPAATCSERDKTLELVDARSATLVFPVGHINSPASMFGHTLLRIDSSSKSRLISYAANYAASTAETNGFIYAYKGIFGGYYGYYSMMPYYEKVKEYNDLEHRDMWEYRLRLTEGEVRTMMNHLWELQTISSPYYFFDENCSYNLLFIIEAARPELHLTDRTGLYVLPTDTIRVTQQSGILEEPHYRPSQGTRIRSILAALSPPERRNAHALALGKETADDLRHSKLPVTEKMKMLDVAAEYVQMRYARKEVGKEHYSKLYLQLLRERSRLGAPQGELYKIDEPVRPEGGHGTRKVALGMGVRRGEPQAELQLRPTFHGLLDPDQGYIKGAQIEFLSTSLLYNADTESVRLKKLHLIDIVSLAPRDTFFKPLSWKAVAGIDREAMRTGNDALVYRVNTGFGYAYSTPWDGIVYGMGEMDVAGGGKVRAGISLGPGVALGVLEQLTKWWKVHLFARGFLYRLGDERDTVTVGAAQNFRVTQNNSVTMEYTRQYVESHLIQEAGFAWNYYF